MTSTRSWSPASLPRRYGRRSVAVGMRNLSKDFGQTSSGGGQQPPAPAIVTRRPGPAKRAGGAGAAPGTKRTRNRRGFALPPRPPYTAVTADVSAPSGGRSPISNPRRVMADPAPHTTQLHAWLARHH